MSTPRSLQHPDGVRRSTVATSRGDFAALEALPVAGPADRGTALLVPGYTGSKEDFLAVLPELAADGRRVIAIDQRGQYETPGPDDPAAYTLPELAADIIAVLHATGASHLVGHSFGGLVTREAVLADPLRLPKSLTLMSSGPAEPTGPRSAELRDTLAYLDGSTDDLRAKVTRMWHGTLEPRALADGVPEPVVAFLRERTLRSSPTGFAAMGLALLKVQDRTPELAKLGLRTLVLYGEQDNTWSPAEQEEMAARLTASRVCVPAAAHSPAVEAPATTAAALTAFWNGS